MKELSMFIDESGDFGEINDNKQLLKIKKSENRLSKSEKQLFYKPQELKRAFLKRLIKNA